MKRSTHHAYAKLCEVRGKMASAQMARARAHADEAREALGVQHEALAEHDARATEALEAGVDARVLSLMGNERARLEREALEASQEIEARQRSVDDAQRGLDEARRMARRSERIGEGLDRERRARARAVERREADALSARRARPLI